GLSDFILDQCDGMPLYAEELANFFLGRQPLGKKPLNGNVDSLPADPFEKEGEQRDVEFAADEARKLRCPSCGTGRRESGGKQIIQRADA
ncbi:hypothetical protein, partial [Rhizobium johnstonii]|uniref:hypothetical protein n=1 Tax=Rhizobium johnstonii TaxID=3019933 RepID=UPI003F98CE10